MAFRLNRWNLLPSLAIQWLLFLGTVASIFVSIFEVEFGGLEASACLGVIAGIVLLIAGAFPFLD